MGKLNQFLFDVQLNWLKKKEGIFTSRSVHDAMKVAAPGSDGENLWSPEHLLLCSLCSSFMTTFLFYAKKEGFKPAGFECSAIGQVELVDGKLHYTAINVYPVVKASSQAGLKKAHELLALAEADCLIARTLNTNIFYHSVAEPGARSAKVLSEQ
jgi:organic hydroperoxide reductase OsmC/OhrA